MDKETKLLNEKLDKILEIQKEILNKLNSKTEQPVLKKLKRETFKDGVERMKQRLMLTR